MNDPICSLDLPRSREGLFDRHICRCVSISVSQAAERMQTVVIKV